MSAEQLAAFALLGMQKSPSPSLGEIRNMGADYLKNSCTDEPSFPIASPECSNSTDKYRSKKKLKARKLSRPLPLKKRSKFEQHLRSNEPVSPIEASPQKHVPCITPEKRNPPFSIPKNLKSMTFAEKLHYLLGQKEIQDGIAWVPDGRAFRILDAKLLQERYILQTYFGYSDFSEFVQELQQNGLKKADHGNDKNTYYHEYFIRGMPHLAKLVTKSDQPSDMADASLCMPALPRMTDAALQKKEPVLKVDMQCHEELLVQELLTKQLLQRHAQALIKCQKPTVPDFTSEQEALQYLLAGSMPPAFHPAPAPEPSLESNTLLLQNVLAEILIQQAKDKAECPIGNNPLLPIMPQGNREQGMNALLMDQRALEALLGQPQISDANNGTNPFWGQLNQQDQSMLLVNLLGLQSTPPASAFFSQPRHDPSLAAMNLHLQSLQPSQPKTPDLQSALLSMLLQYQG